MNKKKTTKKINITTNIYTVKNNKKTINKDIKQKKKKKVQNTKTLDEWLDCYYSY